MNLQELQTIITNRLPVKIVIFNNEGYQAIVQSQSNFFHRLTGCTKSSGVQMPSFEKIAKAFGYPYIKINSNEEVKSKIKSFLEIEGYAICEIIQDTEQNIEPRVKSKKLEDGTMISLPISDLSPFLSDEEHMQNQFQI